MELAIKEIASALWFSLEMGEPLSSRRFAFQRSPKALSGDKLTSKLAGEFLYTDGRLQQSGSQEAKKVWVAGIAGLIRRSQFMGL